MKKLIKKIFEWIFREELDKLNEQIRQAQVSASTCNSYVTHIKNILQNIDVSVDVHEYDHRYSPSWAVISLQGQRTDYIKFMDLGDRELRDIANFLRQFERGRNIKIDAHPQTSQLLKIQRHEDQKYF